MVAAKIVSSPARMKFKAIISQLDKARTEKKTLKVVEGATAFLKENDIGWDAVSIVIPNGYVVVSQRSRIQRNAAAVAKAAAGLNGTGVLGRDGRAMLKTAVTRHADWPMVKETMGLDIVHITVPDLIAVAQLLGINEKFIQMTTLSETPAAPAADDDEDGISKEDMDRINKILKEDE